MVSPIKRLKKPAPLVKVKPLRYKVPEAAKKPKTSEKKLKQLEAARAKSAIVNRKYDWDFAREYFVSAEKTVSLKQVSNHCQIPYDQVRARAARERWNYLRAQEQQRIFAAKRKDHLTRMADQSIKFDDSVIDVAKLGMSLVAGRLAEIAAQFGASQGTNQVTIEKLKRGEPVDWKELRSVVNYKELRELSQAGLAFQDMGMRAFGTDVQKFEFEGIGGDSVEMVINVGAELGKDDPGRLAALIEALERSGLAELNIGEHENGIVDGEIVESKDEQLAIEAGRKEDGTSNAE